MPAATSPNVSSVVATGRRMNGLDRDMREFDLVLLYAAVKWSVQPPGIAEQPVGIGEQLG
jgi:hypothetical protein